MLGGKGAMIPLFKKESLSHLKSLSCSNSLYAFDYDGTLTRIVRTPSQATLSPTTARLLARLSSLAPVAIISGRSVEDLKARLPFAPAFIVGNHGLEDGLGRRSRSLSEAKIRCRAWKAELERSALGPEVEIEDKTYSLSLHCRKSHHKKSTQQEIWGAIAKLSPAPRVISGKAVLNLLPPNAPHKGSAIVRLMKKLGAKSAFYVGDDDTDEDVFRLSGEYNIMSVRVGAKRSSRAGYFIERQSEINRVLKALIHSHSGSLSGEFRVE